MTTSKKLKLPETIVPQHAVNNGTVPKIVLHAAKKTVLTVIKDALSQECFERLKASCFGPIIEYLLQNNICFSRNICGHILKRRLSTTRSEELWFLFGEQPMRFSLREFVMITGLPDEDTRKSEPYERIIDPWMKTQSNLKKLLITLTETVMTDNEKLRLAVFLVGDWIVKAKNPSNNLAPLHMQRAASFEEYCSNSWGRIGYTSLVEGIFKIDAEKLLSNKLQTLEGFAFAFHVWALASVEELSNAFGRRENLHRSPLILQWTETKTPTEKEVEIISEKPKVHISLPEYKAFQKLFQQKFLKGFYMDF